MSESVNDILLLDGERKVWLLVSCKCDNSSEGTPGFPLLVMG